MYLETQKDLQIGTKRVHALISRQALQFCITYVSIRGGLENFKFCNEHFSPQMILNDKNILNLWYKVCLYSTLCENFIDLLFALQLFLDVCFTTYHIKKIDF
jgi:hypothetical protein